VIAQIPAPPGQTGPPQPYPLIRAGLPLLFEDDEAEAVDMGENNLHVTIEVILYVALKAHFAGREDWRVFANMNLYYPPPPGAPAVPQPYVSPDVMVVRPARSLPEDVASYHIPSDGPAPLATVEVLSERTAQQGDLGAKLTVYSLLGVPEYIVVDPRRRYQPLPLLLKRLQPDRSWVDEHDADGGVTSQLGFRVIIDSDGRPRVLNAATGYRYIRPDEADQRVREEADARAAAEARVRELEIEVRRLRPGS
jgi:Uma2 family endonuclease